MREKLDIMRQYWVLWEHSWKGYSNSLSSKINSFETTHITQLMIYHTYQIWESSRIGSFDFVKNSLAADPEILKQCCLVLFWTYSSKNKMWGKSLKTSATEKKVTLTCAHVIFLVSQWL